MSKIRIVIATFIYTNYGGILQAYALQKYLKKFDNLDVYNLDFRTQWHINDSRIFNLYGNVKSKIGQIIFSLLRYSHLAKRKKRTEFFKLKYFNFTERFYSSDQFVKLPPKADIYITGSDQVFNPNGKYIDVFFLNFKKKNFKKIAYAASFGINEFTAEIEDKIKPLLLDFDAMSCREKSGTDFLNKISSKNVIHSVDPSFLLSKDEWLEIIQKPKISEKYILIYALASDDKLLLIAKKIKEKTGNKIVCIRSNSRDFIDADIVDYSCGPAEFLGYIQRAEFVVTDSFHGTVFSIIFEKFFFTYISRPDVSTRILSLIDIIGAKENLITDSNLNDFKFSLIIKKYNLTQLENQIEISKNYINNLIVNNKKLI